jgi:hypothetical protein
MAARPAAMRFPAAVLLFYASLAPAPPSAQSHEPYGIEVVDRATGRGVPLVLLRTTGGLTYVTDSAGRVAFDEPGLLGETVWFFVESDGYALTPDGFGYAGQALATEPGGRGRIDLERTQIAERLYRVTGQGVYRDTVLLGEEPPIAAPLRNGGVIGQDSVVTARLGGRVLWFWGDTSRARYPLGLFEAAGAWSAAPDELDPERGIDLCYFVDAEGFARAMCPIDGPGPVWLGGLCVVPGDGGGEVLVAHYARVESLGVLHEQGIARWDAGEQVFRKWRELPLEVELHPAGHPVLVEDGGERWYVFPAPYPHLRAPATLAGLGDPDAYEAFTCLAPGAAWSADAPLERDAGGHVVWAWKRATAPVTEEREDELVRAGRLAPEERLARLADPATGARVRAHNGSIRWNARRGRWVWLVNEVGGTSNLGEVWYAEADTLLGPWLYARKVVTHADYSFYNVAQHDFLARGRHVYFEGTYTRAFSGAPVATPRYDYNQVMYRVDVDDPRLRAPELVYRFGAAGDGAEGTLDALRAAGVPPADAMPVGLSDGAELCERVLARGTARPVGP